MVLARSRLANCRGEMLIARVSSSSPCSSQLRICWQALSMIQSPSGTMSPVSSARGMNSVGGMSPSSGSCQRTRASTPMVWAEFTLISGW